MLFPTLLVRSDLSLHPVGAAETLGLTLRRMALKPERGAVAARTDVPH